MDNRIDHTEDLQATAQHPAGRVPGAPLDPNDTGLTAGPHNDPPQTEGAGDSSDTWQKHADDGSAGNQSSLAQRSPSRMRALAKGASTHALPVLIGAAGLSLVLLAVQRARSH
jgi:hypothetical protein